MRNVLGSHVEQKGSDVNPDRLRFDFSHFSAMTEEELKQVETIVNEKIAEALPVETSIMSLEEAKKTGHISIESEPFDLEFDAEGNLVYISRKDFQIKQVQWHCLVKNTVIPSVW